MGRFKRCRIIRRPRMPSSSKSKSQKTPAPIIKHVGCITCKARHVRCDGTRPRCSACQVSSRLCEYPCQSGESSKYPESAQLKIVLWQPRQGQGLHKQRISPIPGLTSDEGYAFELFRTKIAGTLGGMFDSDFWSRHVLQIAHHEPAIRHAIVAVASVADSLGSASVLGSRHQLRTQPKLDKVFTIRQHMKAVELTNHMIHQGSHETRRETILVNCAVLICFAMFQTDIDSALRQMSSGLYVFFDWYSRPCQRTLSDSEHELANQLRRLFGRLMLQTIMFVETRPTEWEWLKPGFSPALPLIPTVFSSVSEARDSLDECVCALSHNILSHAFGRVMSQDPDDQFAAVIVPRINASLFSAWSQCFKAFMIANGKTLSPREQKAAIVLEIDHITWHILTSVGIFGKEASFDTFEQSMIRILDLVASVAATPENSEVSPNGGYVLPSFDMGVLPPLYFVASRCRHPGVRRRAIRLLREHPRQEGIWHSGMLANIAQRIMEMEEAGCADTVSESRDIPESARITLLNAKVNSRDRKVQLHCSRHGDRELRDIGVLHQWVEY